MDTLLGITPEELYQFLKKAEDFKSAEDLVRMIHDHNAFLTRPIILKLVEKEIIRIDPFNPKNLGNVSYDCTLDHTEFRQAKTGNRLIKITNDIDYREHTEIFYPENGVLILSPGETILARTLEVIKLPANIIGAIDGRSRFARMFFTVHVTATYIQPGTANRQILEISNIGRNTMELHLKGLKICQVYFMRCSGSAPHNGRYTAVTDW